MFDGHSNMKTIPMLSGPTDGTILMSRPPRIVVGIHKCILLCCVEIIFEASLSHSVSKKLVADAEFGGVHPGTILTISPTTSLARM